MREDCPNEAFLVCEEAIARWPDSAAAHVSRAVSLRLLQQADAALASCDKAVALRPDYVEAWDKRAAALQDLNRQDEALQSCQTAIRLDPDFAPAYAHAGLICLQLGNYPDGWRLSE